VAAACCFMVPLALVATGRDIPPGELTTNEAHP
jgi:hypothetical protein